MQLQGGRTVVLVPIMCLHFYKVGSIFLYSLLSVVTYQSEHFSPKINQHNKNSSVSLSLMKMPPVSRQLFICEIVLQRCFFLKDSGVLWNNCSIMHLCTRTMWYLSSRTFDDLLQVNIINISSNLISLCHKLCKHSPTPSKFSRAQQIPLPVYLNFLHCIAVFLSILTDKRK